MNLSISFSGGKTSAYMTKWLLDNKRHDYDQIVITFANTGQENEETLRFVDRCDKEWNLGVVWLEAVVNPQKGIGNKHKIVTFETADRNGTHFEEYIKKHGIPNQSFPKCTDELKLAPMRSYLRSIGWKNGTYQTAVGIRVDEMDRISSRMVEQNLIYPLCEFTKVNKEMVNLWWEKQSFNLDLKEHQGNCKWCWKKSKRKLLTIAKESPEAFEFPIRMEAQHRFAGPWKDPSGFGRVFFRKNQTALDIIEESKSPFVPFVESGLQTQLFDYEMDSAGGCSESCEVY